VSCFLEDYGARGYLGGKYFLGCEDNMAYFTRKWRNNILLGDYDYVWIDFNCAIDNWWSVEKYWCGV